MTYKNELYGMKDVDLDEFGYGAKWGLTDLYEQAEKELRAALEAPEDFRANWSAKKEIRDASLVREFGTVYITVTAHMDDLWEDDDLIYDALWTSCKVEEELPEDIVDSIREGCIEEIDDQTTESDTLPASATYEEIMAAVSRLEDMAEANNVHMYDLLCEMVKAHWEYMHSDEYRKLKGES